MDCEFLHHNNLLTHFSLDAFSSLVGGGAVSKVDPDSAAVGPAWRTALTDMVVLPPWSNDITPEANYQVAKAQIDPLKALAPPPLGGRYYNEVRC